MLQHATPRTEREKKKKDFPKCVKLWCLLQWVTLTCTHSFFVPRLVRAVVAVQSLVVVARVGLVAFFAHLPGAGLAAVAAVHEEADARRTLGGRLGTLAGPLAVARAAVRLCGRRGDGVGWRHGSGIQGGGLEKERVDLQFNHTVQFLIWVLHQNIILTIWPSAFSYFWFTVQVQSHKKISDSL